MAGGGWLSTHEDVTERRRVEERIEHMARHDALTDLPNRVLFKEKLDEAAARAQARGMVAVLCLDLDRFKQVNDTLGHGVGDLLLKGVAARLRGCAGEADTIARLSGDEFAVIRERVETAEDAAALARRILEELAAPFLLDGHQVAVGGSIGIALGPADGVDADRLLKNADTAAYRAKSDGRGTYRFFEAGMDERLQERRATELALRAALSRGQFELFYQPLVNVRDRRITGFEALLRWRHPDRGLVSPAEFIPLAEEIGVIVPIGEWVLRTACAEAAGWPSECRVAINVSPAQFSSRNLVSAVTDALAAAGLAPHRLELEITESVLLENSAAVTATLDQLNALGVRISMDDFGTGYSSLSYLQKFPFDKIKIDASFIHSLGRGEESIAIVRAIAGLGKSLGITTTAEGVETEEQLESILAEGCDEVQGYYFSAPRPAKEIANFFRFFANGSPPDQACFQPGADSRGKLAAG
jgi:diguanylate cyclase (GGDEF)-like protein